MRTIMKTLSPRAAIAAFAASLSAASALAKLNVPLHRRRMQPRTRPSRTRTFWDRDGNLCKLTGWTRTPEPHSRQVRRQLDRNPSRFAFMADRG